MYRVDIDMEVLGDLAVRAASLPQLKRADTAFGDGFELAPPNAAGSALRICGVAPLSAGVRPVWN